MKDCRFKFKGSGNRIIIGERCVLNGLRIMLEGDGNFVMIGNGVVVNASIQKPVVMNAIEGTNIYIGDGCLFSNSIELHTSDYHSILNVGSSVRINPAKDIRLKERVWVGLCTIILKGTYISEDTIVGSGSVVSGCFEESNVVIVGCPAGIKKRNVRWVHKKL